MTLGIIPARQGSKRLLDKNLQKIGERTLLEWALEAALQAQELDALIVSSDDERVLSLAESIDGPVALRRPAEICGDKALAISYVEHALEKAKLWWEDPVENVVIIQVTSPFVTPEDIDRCVTLLKESPEASSVVTVTEVEHAHHPTKYKRLNGNLLEDRFEAEEGRMAYHQMERLFVRSGSVYATRVATVTSGSLLGKSCFGVQVPRERSVDINDEFDLEFARFLYSRNDRP